MSAPVTQAIDRSMRVERGHIVKTAWVSADRVRLACRERMAVGDVERAYQRALGLGDCASWPPPVGYWDCNGDRFVLTDGRHEFIARLMLGQRTILVAWVAKEDA